jgi:hypothetical protein
MEYLKIKADYKYFKGRLTRTLYVKKDIKLHELGCVLVTAFGGTFEHFFLFETKTKSYVPKTFMEDFVGPNDLYMNDYTINDLGDSFTFEYDTGDSWDFNVKVYKRTKEIDSDNFAFIIDGVGQGIWEDNSYSLDKYLNGEITNLNEEDDEEGIYFPWNFQVESFADFDLPIDKEFIQEDLDTVDIDIEQYLAMKDISD